VSQLEKTFDINLYGPIRVIREFLQLIRQSKGKHDLIKAKRIFCYIILKKLAIKGTVISFISCDNETFK
jgi:NAD(P)-dependent dehydrogenase (short-subunit alcohol dehydrogenase family)